MSANAPIVCVDTSFSNREKPTVTKNGRSKRNVNRKNRRTKGTTQNQPTEMETDEHDEAMANQENSNINIQAVDDDDQATQSDQSDIIGGEQGDVKMKCGENSDDAQDNLSQGMEIDGEGSNDTMSEVNMDENETKDEEQEDIDISTKPAKKRRRADRPRATKKKKETENERKKEKMDEDQDENENNNDDEKEEEEEEQEEEEEELKGVKAKKSRNVAKSKARAPKKRKANRVQVAATSDDEEDDDVNVNGDEDDEHDKRKKTKKKKNKQKESKPKARKDRTLQTLDHFKTKREQRFVSGKTVMIELKKGDEPTRGWVHEMSQTKVCIRYYVMESKTKREKTKQKWFSKDSKKIYPFNRSKRD